MDSKEGSELWEIKIENMEILRMNELKKLLSLSIYGAVLPKTSAFQGKNQTRTSQRIPNS